MQCVDVFSLQFLFDLFDDKQDEKTPVENYKCKNPPGPSK